MSVVGNDKWLAVDILCHLGIVIWALDCKDCVRVIMGRDSKRDLEDAVEKKV